MNSRWDSDEKPDRSVKGPARKDAPCPHGLDPYFRWAVHTEWRGFQRLARWDKLGEDQHLIQIVASVDSDEELKVALHDPVLSQALPWSYLQPIPGTGKPTRHFTAQFTFDQRDWLSANPLNLRWKLAMPLRDAQAAADASPKGLFGPDRDAADMQAKNVVADAVAVAVAVAAEKSKPSGPDPSAPTLSAAIAVIDFGCPFLNTCFESADGGTRVRVVWDQGSNPGKKLSDAPKNSWPWQAPQQFNHGRMLHRAAADAMCAAARAPGGPEEALVYRGIDHLIVYSDPRRRIWQATHGGHVLGMAGAAPDPLSGEMDAASTADLVFVQLPSLTATDSAGGSLAAHLLDGVRFAMAQVKTGGPLAVVISYGNLAGPHDGTSLIEKALEELLLSRPDNFAVVLAGGNARAYRGHARRTVRKDRSVLLRVQVVADDITDTFVEAWYPKAGPALQVRVRGPGQVWSGWVDQGGEQLMRAGSTDRDVVVMVRHDRTAPNGDGAQILLALAPTAPPPGVDCSLVEAGLWEIELRLADTSIASSAVLIDAWIERDDPQRGSAGERTHFLDQTDEDEYDTVSCIATGSSTVKAFGFNRASGLAAQYSSLPRKSGDDLRALVVCEEDDIDPNLTGPATRSNEVYRMKGTSVAAPVLARQLFNVMALAPAGAPIKRTQWAQVLQALFADTAQDIIKPFSAN